MLPTSTPVGSPVQPDHITATARWAERRGFDSVWAGDHLVHPSQFLEALICLSFAAAQTERIQLGTGVLLLPLRRLTVVAKQLGTLAILSGGRLVVGAGLGGEFPAEWEATGVPLGERGARLEEALPLLRRLLGGESVSYDGVFHRLNGVTLRPAAPPVPLWLAGRHPAALDRAARLADGWLGFLLTPHGFVKARTALEDARARAGRRDKSFEYGMLLPVRVDDADDGAARRAAERLIVQAGTGAAPAPIEVLERLVVAGTPKGILGQLRDLAEAGCTTFVLHPIETGREGLRHLDALADDVLPELRPVILDKDS